MSELVCPVHGFALREVGDDLRCERGETYPIVAGVPVVVQGATIKPRPTPLSSAVIDQLMNALCLSSAHRGAIEQVFSHQFTFVEKWMQVEADQYLYRVAGTHLGLRQALQLQDDEAPITQPVNERSAPYISSIFSVARVRPGEGFGINVRLENRGSTTLSSNGSRPINLSYHWIDQNGGACEGHRTSLLDDLLPGRSITMPVFVVAPAIAGSSKLIIRVVQEAVSPVKAGWLRRVLHTVTEHVSWFDQSLIEFNIAVGEGHATFDKPAWTTTGRQFEYFDDHNEAVRLLGEWRNLHFSRPVQRIVELGGNANPMIAHVDALQKYNVDVDPFGMIVGNMLQAETDHAVRYVIADGMAMPMPARSIDMLVMFATFHHFPDPIGLLSRLSEFVCDDGLICLMCEPIGHVHRDTVYAEYLAEIRRGVNEQSFELWEYQQMFDAAELDVVAAQIDGGSAKFALRPRG